MKKISTFILAALLLSSAGATAQTVRIQTDSASVTSTATDSVPTTASLITDVATLDEGEPKETPTVSIANGKWTIDYAGDSYELTELVESKALADNYDSLEERASSRLEKESIPAILSLVFGIPCLTIIIALIVILVYSLKRTQGRNELINNAIEHNYQLPDSFYDNQKNSSRPDAPFRDSRRFYRAISLLSVGIALIIFAISGDIPFFYVAGGIPFLIGIGQMIGYFCIPSTDYPRGPINNNYPPRDARPYQPVPPYPFQPMNQPSAPQQPSVPQQPVTPPPYNPGTPNECSADTPFQQH